MAVRGQYLKNTKRRQRNVNANIDTTLFGADRSTAVGKTKNTRSTNRRSASAPMQPASSVTVSANELFAMQGASIILSPLEQAQLKQERDSQKYERMRKGMERKERMMYMEEEKRRQAPILSEEQILAREQQNKVLAMAKQKMDEELDDVKHMNQMVAYARCVTIRDAQIREKAMLQAQLADANWHQDQAMEIDRVRQLKMHEERARMRAGEQKIGAQVIIQQIQEREAARLKEQERQEQEQEAMGQKQRELVEQEAIAHQIKLDKGRKLMDDVRKENDRQARSKLALRQMEINEGKKIQEYIRAKEAREAQAEEEKERIREQQEQELARMGAMREKADNRQAQVDGLRARRYQEAKDRAWRQKQLEEAQKAASRKTEVAVAREQQRREKALRMANQALRERSEYERVIEWQKGQAEMDEVEKVKQQGHRDARRESLLAQIKTHDGEKYAAREAFLAQGKEAALQREMDRLKLAGIKEMKLGSLKSSGVPEKYTAELAKKKCLAA